MIEKIIGRLFFSLLFSLCQVEIRLRYEYLNKQDRIRKKTRAMTTATSTITSYNRSEPLSSNFPMSENVNHGFFTSNSSPVVKHKGMHCLDGKYISFGRIKIIFFV